MDHPRAYCAQPCPRHHPIQALAQPRWLIRSIGVARSCQVCLGIGVSLRRCKQEHFDLRYAVGP